MPNEKLCVAKSFSLRRELIAAIRTRAMALGTSMSSYVAAALERDLDQTPSSEPGKIGQTPSRGVVVEFEDE
jgi:hypothetical protein